MLAATVIVTGALGAVDALINPLAPLTEGSAAPSPGIVQRLTEPFPGQRRISVLLLGCDDVEEVSRSDTILLLLLNPQLKRAALLSIPRDTRVEIPGHGRDKINHAYAYGEVELTRETIERFLSINIDYYAQVGFGGFVAAIDELGGVDIQVPRTMHKHTYYGSIDLEEGYQHLDGSQVLQFVRYRNDSDIQRGKRQQQLLRALIDQKLNPANYHRLISAGSKLIKQLNTDIGWWTACDFLRVIRQIPASEIMTATVPIADISIKGVYYGQVQEYDLRQLLAEIDNHLSGINPIRATVEVCNGSGLPGAATAAAEVLTDSGFEIAHVGNADSFDYGVTVINHRRGARPAAQEIKQALGLPEAQIVEQRDGDDDSVEVAVVLGADFATATALAKQVD